MEGEIWKTQPPDKIGKRVQPDCITEWAYNEELAYEEPSAPELGLNGCTPEEQWAQEADQDGHKQLLFPAGVGVYEPTAQAQSHGFPTSRRILVADRYNHRMLVFVSNGLGGWTPLDEVVPGDVNAAHWNGFPMPSAPWPAGFEGLSFPEHVSIDRGGYVWVANLGRCRVDVFTPTGLFQAGFPLSETCDYWAGLGLFPYGVAVNDDAEFGVAGRVAVIAQDYDTQGTKLIVLDAQSGTEVGRLEPDPFTGELDDPGAFNLATAVDYHRTGGVDRLVVADTNNNRVQVFSTQGNGVPNATPVLIFGATELTDPATNQPISESRLQWPYSLHVDARGRLLVSDSIGNRETFFSLNFSGTPSVSFLYELNARGGLNGVPRGVAEDANHSLYIVDTGNHEVEVFEIPELAVVSVTTSTSSPRVGDPITVDFTVLVPETKSALTNVVPTCGSPQLTFVSGPTPIDGTPALVGGAVPEMQPAVVNGVAGAVYRYSCTFTASAPGDFEVELSACGGPASCTDPDVTVKVEAPVKITGGAVVDCGGPCEGAAPSIVGDVTDPAPVNGFYPADATITLTATDRRTQGVDPSGIKRIFWKWVSSSAMNLVAVDPLLACPGQPTPTQCVEFPEPAPANVLEQSVDVFATLDGVSTLEFWAEDFHGNVSEHVRVPVAVDTMPPDVLMNLRTAPGGVAGWFNTDVYIDLTFSDPLGLTAPSQIVTDPPNITEFHFANEGRDQAQSVTVTDLAGNTYGELLSSDFLVVNIDKGAPQTTAASGMGLLTNNQIFLSTAPPVFTLSAIDPLLSTGEEGSGVTQTFYRLSTPSSVGPVTQYLGGSFTVSTLGSHTLEYWSKDLVGNEETHEVRSFYVNATPTAANDTATTNEDIAVNVNVLANDSDANDRTTDPLSVTVLSATNGSAAVQPDQSVTFTPQPDFSGTASFSYRLSDAHGGTATASVTITVNTTNDPPVAVTDVIGPLVEGTPAVTFDVLANDIDPDGDALTFVSHTALTPAVGTLTPLGNGVFSYLPPASIGTAAQTMTFTYDVRDPAGATATGTVRITVRPRNQAPDCSGAYGGEIWPPNHKKFEIATIKGVTDPEGQAITFVIDKIMQDEETDTTGDGKFSPDATGVGTATAKLRAERAGNGNGRVYEISFTATDALGGSCTGTVQYTVPHSRGANGAAIAGPMIYDSTVHVPGTRNK